MACTTMGLLPEDVPFSDRECSACQRPNSFLKKCQGPNPSESGRGERLSQAGPFRGVEFGLSTRHGASPDRTWVVCSGSAGLFPYFVHLYDLLHRTAHELFYVYIKIVLLCTVSMPRTIMLVGRTDHTVTVLSELRGNSSRAYVVFA
jgi:hypothetical protein